MRLLLAVLLLLLTPAIAFAGPPPFDPSAMSGMARPDPKLPVGTITVRCLGKAGFGDPKVGLEVKLAVRGLDGKMESLTATTAEEGRATFNGLAKYLGGAGMVSATIGSGRVTSQTFQLPRDMGVALLLVEGASAAPKPTHGEAGGPEIPPPGTAFPLRGTPAGSLTVGTFDLAARKPIDGVEVTLTITPPSGDPIVRKGSTGQGGKFVFDKLLPPDVPEGSKLVVEGTLRDELRRSEPFEMPSDAGMALVLAEGAEHFVPPQPEQPTQAQRTQLPAPRRTSQLPAGSVDVLVVDGNDQPIKGQRVTVIRRTAAGVSGKYSGETAADGRARIDGIEVQQDAGYFVQAVYDGGPYQSGFFFMDKRGGVQVAMRVYKTTSDTSVVRSSLQYDVDERENDLAQVVQIYEVMVQGEKAFWDPEFQIAAPTEAKGFTVLRPAEDFLSHEDEKAPFAKLSGPIAPGEVANLSVAYLLPHDGAFELEWTPPFQVVQSIVFVGPEFTLAATDAKEATDIESPIPDKTVWMLAELEPGSPVEFGMSGMKTQDPTFKRIAIALAILMGLAMFLAFALVPRQSLRDRLTTRRAELLERLIADPKSKDRDRILRTLDRIYRQLEALERKS